MTLTNTDVSTLKLSSTRFLHTTPIVENEIQHKYDTYRVRTYSLMHLPIQKSLFLGNGLQMFGTVYIQASTK